MNMMNFFFNPMQLAGQAYEYIADSCQRTVLYWDTLRKRGNNYLDHLDAGQPPVLIFDYEMVMDGRTFEQPVNYALLRIMDRRKKSDRRLKQRPQDLEKARRRPKKKECMLSLKRPIVVIDPRAGHGPGIGGSKLNSQIGVALDQGHPVYFITFYTDPEPGQTISDVEQAEVRFLEQVALRHPDLPKPAVIGNCQAGWAAALIASDRPDVTGPIVLNGSPLSYWGGVEGANPMRYRGGLFGGIWLTSLCCDLGNGQFDGVHLVAGFEDLNPANTLWAKQYHLYANVDTEQERYLEFEKWWGGFFKMNTDEIHFIVDGLFMGNELEQGSLRMDNGKYVNLKNFKNPIMVFASGGDNITPPPQALNWIYKVYGTVEEIKRCGQVIAYMVHDKIGHLGIFVSGGVAKKEHNQIIDCVEMLSCLSPGLYEMTIEGKPSRPGLYDYNVHFEERDMKDILELDDGLEDEEVFLPVRTVSRYNDMLYQNFIRPWVRLGVNELTALCMEQLHPLRVQRYAISDLNPFCLPLESLAQKVKAERRPADKDNPFLKWEKMFSDMVTSGLKCYGQIRDSTHEHLFFSIYNNPFMQMMCMWNNSFTKDSKKPVQKKGQLHDYDQRQWACTQASQGGFAEAVVRIMLAMSNADDIVDKREFYVLKEVFQNDYRLSHLDASYFMEEVKKQSSILELEPELAFDTLKTLLPGFNDRKAALDIALKIAMADKRLVASEYKVLDRIVTTLGIPN